MKNKAILETANKYGILPHLEFCTIGRAAQLFECEIDDLLHLIAEGLIAGYVFLRNEPAWTYHFAIDIPEQGFDYPDDLEEPPPPDPTDSYNRRFDEHTRMSVKEFHSGYEISAVLNGFWRIEPKIYFHEKYINGEASPYSVTVLARADSGAYTEAYLKDRVQYPNFNEFYLKKSCLTRLRDSLASGKPLSKLWGYRTKASEFVEHNADIDSIQKKHGNTERFATYREMVLKAAIYAMKNGPEFCGNTGWSWARHICDTEKQLFDNHVAPLSEKSIAELLNSALNNGALSEKK